ncbi:hypothetical protein MNBD_GAMMA23-2123 [hydrothermal vent metagenome]|uniref:Type VI secretion lipoprotein/VasD n=1 Tax=hydrothermal vent metagenome TaxID=652676 RepID=A0A3B0ZUI6_9ZZZZ
MIRKKIITLVFVSSITLLISACSSMNEWVGTKLGFDTDLTLNLKVDADINPDDKKRPSPLFVRLYELKTNKMFNRADFIGLYERDKEVLGADLVAKQELKRLVPGVSREEKFVLNKETRYIALYAEFLNYKKAKYKIIVPVVSNNVIATSITVAVSGSKLKLVE